MKIIVKMNRIRDRDNTTLHCIIPTAHRGNSKMIVFKDAFISVDLAHFVTTRAKVYTGDISEIR